MNRATVQRRRASLEQAIEVMSNDLNALPVPQCLNCEHFSVSSHCGKFNAEPPKHVTSIGCDSWEYDMLPF